MPAPLELRSKKDGSCLRIAFPKMKFTKLWASRFYLKKKKKKKEFVAGKGFYGQISL